MAKSLTQKQQKYRKVLLCKIHCAPVYLELYKDDRPTWEAMLQRGFGKRSSASLRIDQLIKLLDFLNGKTHSLAEHTSGNQVSYLRALWQQRARCPDDKNLLNFARKNTGLTLINLHALTRQQASGLIAAIKRM